MALNDAFVRNARWSGKPFGDKHTDGGGMYLLVMEAGKYWRMAYRFAGKQKSLALGVYPSVSLAKARKKRDEARELLADGQDPSLAKREAKIARREAAENTFEAVAREWLKESASDRQARTQRKTEIWLEKDIFPIIGKLPISTVTPPIVMSVLDRASSRGALETAHRLKQTIGMVFRFAVKRGKAARDVTADLRDAVATPAHKNFAAITDPRQVGRMMMLIDGYHGHACARAALRLAPLVFVRPGELRTAEWTEIDLDSAMWTIPGRKMKMKADHIVPLSQEALAILKEMHAITGHARYVFPSIRTDSRPMSENTINAALRALGYAADEHTGHGFRAMARTLLDEKLRERVDIIEHQLAHQVKDVHGRAYNRTAFLEDRRAMMQRWADYLDQLRRGAAVAPLKVA